MSTLEYPCAVCPIYNKMHDNHGPFFVFISFVYLLIEATLHPVCHIRLNYISIVMFVLFPLVGFSSSQLANFSCTVFDEIIAFKESNYSSVTAHLINVTSIL